MRVGLLTREFPPAVYGGAGVHVDYLARHSPPASTIPSTFGLTMARPYWCPPQTEHPSTTVSRALRP